MCKYNEINKQNLDQKYDKRTKMVKMISKKIYYCENLLYLILNSLYNINKT